MSIAMTRRVILAGMIAASLYVPRPARAAETSLEKLRFLLGEWEGAGGGGPGQGSGSYSFALEVQGKIMVRKNHADYPASAGRPAISHDDLMVIFVGEGAGALRAEYFDSEGHFIQYGVSVSEDGKTATFVSDSVASQPRYRLSYKSVSDDTVAGKFEVAPPGNPDAFVKYLEWTGRRIPKPDSARSQAGSTHEGVWAAVAGELGGKKFPDEILKSFELTLTQDTYYLRSGEAPDRGMLKVDSSKQPMAMDITGTEGPNKGRTILAIYKLEGERLTICYDLSGASRPSEFTTRTGTQLFLVIYARKPGS